MFLVLVIAENTKIKTQKQSYKVLIKFTKTDFCEKFPIYRGNTHNQENGLIKEYGREKR